MKTTQRCFSIGTADVFCVQFQFSDLVAKQRKCIPLHR